MLAVFMLDGALHGHLLAFLVAPPFLIGGLFLFRLVDRHVKARLEVRTDELRQTLLKDRRQS